MTSPSAISGAPADCDYVVVGSGAGGGTVAARLAEAGMRVVLVEAGSDPREAGGRMPDDYDVPAFQPFASENPDIRWDYFVQHYKDESQERRNPNLTQKGLLYPRASALGGCTAVSSLTLIKPQDSFLNETAALTGDPSWGAAEMQKYWRKVERCAHRPGWRYLSRLGLDPTGHGWTGWTTTERGYRALFQDAQLIQILIKTMQQLGYEPGDATTLFGLSPSIAMLLRHGGKIAEIVAKSILPIPAIVFDLSEEVIDAISEAGLLKKVRTLFLGDAFDPNDRRLVNAKGQLSYLPFSTDHHRRIGTRERLLDVARRYPDRLRIVMNALATRVILDDQRRAIGLEYTAGARMYRAHPSPTEAQGEQRQLHAARGVILACGVFNTPQLLMLSGVGPKAELERFDIPHRVELESVGRNLHEQYEIGVVHSVAKTWLSRQEGRYETGDGEYQKWASGVDGAYATSGPVLSFSRLSGSVPQKLDMFFTLQLNRFSGYRPGYSEIIKDEVKSLTWRIQKATCQKRGRVTLRSNDPRDTPQINFEYFDPDEASTSDYLRDFGEAIRLVRKLMAPLKQQGVIVNEEMPGEYVNTDEELARYVRDTAFGQSAAGTCAIGELAAGAVLDSDFRVHGTLGLYVVDASIFPTAPSFHITSSIYMAAEKAADTLLRRAV